MKKGKRIKLLEDNLREVAKRANHLEDRATDRMREDKGLEPVLTREGPIDMFTVREEAKRIVTQAMKEIW